MLPSAPALAAGHRIQIYEIYYNSPGPDTGSNSSLDAEWVRLHNTSGTRISLTGWTLRDTAGHVFKFAAYTLGAHSYVKIHTGHGTRTQTDRYWNRSWYIWNNTGDTATLADSHGLMNRLRLTGASPATAFAALATCSSMPRRIRRAEL